MIYLDTNSFIHRLHPLTKIVGLLLLFIWPMIFNHPLYLVPILVFVISLSLVAKIVPNLKRFSPGLIILVVFTTLLWALFLRGRKPILVVGPLQISRESLLYGLAMGIRIDTMIISGIIFLSATRTEDFTYALNSLGLPFPVSFALSLSFRLVPSFAATGSSILHAQKSRGLVWESGGLLKRVKKHFPLLIPILVHAIKNASLLAMALESRGFGLTKERTFYLHFKFKWWDLVSLLVLVSLITFSLYIRAMGYGIIFGRL